ncbi:hypothetical protein JCM39068_42370 [Desulfocastanea catecholica]
MLRLSGLYWNMQEENRTVSGQTRPLLSPMKRPGIRQRLKKLTDQHVKQDGLVFNFKVYEIPEINAFAMADGTMCIYSGLMD